MDALIAEPENEMSLTPEEIQLINELKNEMLYWETHEKQVPNE